MTFDAVRLPLTPNVDNVPTLVIFGCALVIREPAKVVATIPVAPKLPTLAFPVAFSVPVIFAPVDVTTNTLATPATLVVILPLTPTISTLLVPFAILETAISPAINVPVTVRFATVIKSVVLSNVKLASCPNEPASLKNTLPFPVAVNVGIEVVLPALSLIVS